MELRDLQKKVVNDSIDYINSKNKNGGICICPTGFGKSIVIADICTKVGNNILVLQPSKELLEQNFNKFNIFSSEKAAIYSASFGKKQKNRVTYATLGSIKDYSIFEDVSLLIIDECHLYSTTSDGMLKKLLSNYKKIKVIGFTATPFKLRSISLGNFFSSEIFPITRIRGSVFKHIISKVEISENIQYWAKLEYKSIKIELDLKLNSTGMDFTVDSLLKADRTLKSTIIESLKELEGKTIVFVSSVNEAENMSKICNNSSFVSANTPKKERENILNNFKNGSIDTVFNVGILTTGFDFPELKNVILARPTNSLALYYQMVGRVCRIGVSKNKGNVIDLAGLIEKFGIVEELNFPIIDNLMYICSKSKFISKEPIKAFESPFDTVSDIESHGEVEFTFGKHKGTKIKDIPKYYLEWVIENVTGFKEIVISCKKYLESLKVNSI